MRFFFLMVFLSFHASADDICGDYLYCYDPDGGTATVTDLSNEFHYVFIGAHPDDELFIYPLLKNFCAENNAHCTMIIMSQGRGGCAAGVSPSSCQLTRALELKNSADYLESDLWHFDFPDGVTEITPYDWSGVVAAYDKKAQDYGASGTVGLLNFILRPLRPISSPLVVVSHDPLHGLAANSECNT